MRTVLWFLVLFALAVAVALFAGNNQATVTVFWPPHRVDLSVNFALLLLLGSVLLLYSLVRVATVLFALPRQARRWRHQHLERAMFVGLLEALVHLSSGRFVRARKAAEKVLDKEAALTRSTGEAHAQALRLRALGHLLVAQSAHGVLDQGARDAHLRLALENLPERGDVAVELREGLQLRAAEWALDDREPAVALGHLEVLGQGAARRTLAQRLRFKAARLTAQPMLALQTARTLGKHGAFASEALQSLLTGLAVEVVQSARDPVELAQAWDGLESAERRQTDVMMAAAQRLLDLHGDTGQALRWLVPVWELLASGDETALGAQQRVRAVLLLEQAFEQSDGQPDGAWLTRIEKAQGAHPRDALLQYLSGVACLRLSLWGKAQLQYEQALQHLRDDGLKRRAWRALARLAEQRDDAAAAARAWRNAAQ